MPPGGPREADMGKMTIAPDNSLHVDTFAAKNSKLIFWAITGYIVMYDTFHVSNSTEMMENDNLIYVLCLSSQTRFPS